MFPEALEDKAKKIFSRLTNFDDFYLAGGTALALQIGHRRSFDFDLFWGKVIPKNLFDKAKRVFSGETLSLSVNNPDELTVFINQIKITFLRYPFPTLFEMVNYQGVKLLTPLFTPETPLFTPEVVIP